MKLLCNLVLGDPYFHQCSNCIYCNHGRESRAHTHNRTRTAFYFFLYTHTHTHIKASLSLCHHLIPSPFQWLRLPSNEATPDRANDPDSLSLSLSLCSRSTTKLYTFSSWNIYLTIMTIFCCLDLSGL